MRRIFAYFVLIVILFVFCPITNRVFSQVKNSSGIAVYLPVLDKTVQEGDIVTLSGQGYILSKVPHDTNMIGVVVKEPAIAFEDKQKGTYPVVSEGKVYIRVSTENGNIKKGDLLTTSTIPGVAMKVTESGYIAATALEGYSSKNIGKIMVVLSMGHGDVSTNVTGGVLRALNYLFNAVYLSPALVFRYVFATVMVVLSFIAALGFFGRISSLGIEALGRNPLASKTIVFGIVMNSCIALGIISAGIAVGYLILVL